PVRLSVAARQDHAPGRRLRDSRPARLPVPARSRRSPACGRSSHRTDPGARGPRPGAPPAATLFRPGLGTGIQRVLEPPALQPAPSGPGSPGAPGQLPGTGHLHGVCVAMNQVLAKHMVTSPAPAAVEHAAWLGDTARRPFSSKEADGLPTLS